MNYKFKFNLIAILATFSGALGTCDAAQVEGQSAIGSGVIRPAEPPMDGAFSAVRPATPATELGYEYELPPIVSVQSRNLPASQERLAEVPPILTPDQMQSRFEAPDQMMANVPPIVTPGQLKNRQLEFPEATPQQNYPEQTPNLLYHKDHQYVQDKTQEFTPAALKSPMEIASQMSSMPLPMKMAPNYDDAPMFAPSHLDIGLSKTDVVQATTTPAKADDETNVAQAAQWANGSSSRNGGISSGGIPIYQAAPSSMGLPPIVQGAVPSQEIPVVQGSVTPMPPIISSQSQMIAPAPMFSAPQIMQAPPMASSVMTESAPSMAIDPSYGQTFFNASPMEAPVISSPGCSNCNTSNCSGGCSSAGSMLGSAAPSACSGCGGGGCNDCGIANSGLSVSSCSGCGDSGCCNQESVTSRFNSCGSISGARRYLIAEALYFTRDDGLIANSNFGALNSFDYELGWRFTLGTRSDSTRGREFSYMGVLPLEQSGSRTDALARISSRFSGTDGFSSLETSAFRNVVEQSESKETNIHSLEYNQVRWGWDVVKTFVGLRYFYVDDSYEMLSRNNLGETGSFQLETNNNLIGPHIGGELFYDVGYRLSYSMFGKAGVYANFNKVDTSLNNNGAQFLNVEDDNVTVSGSLELGLIGHYQISQRSRLRAGYQLLWLGEVASASDNFNPVLTPTTGTSSSDSDDMFFHGLSFGLEIYR